MQDLLEIIGGLLMMALVVAGAYVSCVYVRRFFKWLVSLVWPCVPKRIRPLLDSPGSLREGFGESLWIIIPICCVYLAWVAFVGTLIATITACWELLFLP